MNARRFLFLLLAALMLALIGLAMALTTVHAGPAAPGDRVIEQPDGTRVTVRLWGDEWNHGMETPAGYTVIEDRATGFLVYAAEQPDGTLAPALAGGKPLAAGRDNPTGLPLHARAAPRSLPEQRLAPASLLKEPNRQSFRGAMPVLVILVEFVDQEACADIPLSHWRSLFFSNASKSLKDYYARASLNNLTLTPASEAHGTENDGLVGWVRLTRLHPDGENPDIYSHDVARKALTAANPYVNFASFDKNHDGYVTSSELQVMIIAAGYEATYDGISDKRVWAHAWHLNTAPLTLDGKRVAQDSPSGRFGGYAIVGERFDLRWDWDHDGTEEPSTPVQLGIIAHQFGYLLSWPPLFDTDWRAAGESIGVGDWSLMGTGFWNRLEIDADTPALPDAWLKWYQGWITPTHPPVEEEVEIQRADYSGQALIIGANPNGVDWDLDVKSGQGQYWLIENRQRSGSTYDAGMHGCGLLIWHINETVAPTLEANANQDYPLVELEQADGLRDLYYGRNYGDGGDPWPGTSGHTVFNDTSIPNTHTYQDWRTGFEFAIRAQGCGSPMRFSYWIENQFYYLPYSVR